MVDMIIEIEVQKYKIIGKEVRFHKVQKEVV